MSNQRSYSNEVGNIRANAYWEMCENGLGYVLIAAALQFTFHIFHIFNLCFKSALFEFFFLLLGYLGCSENVLPIFDKMCSGKVECSYDVNDLLRESVQPCDEAKPYLEASYECLPGMIYISKQ